MVSHSELVQLVHHRREEVGQLVSVVKEREKAIVNTNLVLLGLTGTQGGGGHSPFKVCRPVCVAKTTRATNTSKHDERREEQRQTHREG